MEPVLMRPWEATWWSRLVSLAMLAALLIAGYGAASQLWSDDEQPEGPTREAIDLYQFIEVSTVTIERD